MILELGRTKLGFGLFFSLFFTCSAQGGDYSIITNGRIKNFTHLLLPKESSNHERKFEDDLRKAFIDYYVVRLYLNGELIFNDQYSIYLDSVGNVFASTPKMENGEAKTFLISSPDAYVFSISSGYTFISTGLISRLDNEVQLAFLLGTEKKAISLGLPFSYKFNLDSLNAFSVDIPDYLNYYIVNSYSNKDRFKNDEKVAESLISKGYSIISLIELLEQLGNPILNYKSGHFRKSYFENEYIKLPNSIFTTPKNLGINKRYNKYYSEKDLAARRENLFKLMSLREPNAPIKNSRNFLSLVSACRLENIRLLLASARYQEAIYQCDALEDIGYDAIVLEKYRLKALYGIAKYKILNRYEDIANNVVGEQVSLQHYNNFFASVGADELSFLAFSKLYKFTLSDSSRYFARLRDDLLWQMKQQYRLDSNLVIAKANEFLEKINVSSDSLFIEEDYSRNKFNNEIFNDTVKSKYNQLRILRSKRSQFHSGSDSTSSLIKFGYFVPLLKDSTFLSLFEIKCKKDALLENDNFISGKRNFSTMNQFKEFSSSNHTVSKIFVINPSYYLFDRKDKLKGLHNFVDLNSKFSEDFKSMALKSGLAFDMITPVLFNEDNLEEYKVLATANSLRKEILLHSDIDIIPSESEYCTYLEDKYSHTNFLFNDFYVFRVSNSEAWLSYVMLLTFYAAPWGISDLVKKHWDTALFTEVYNGAEGKLIGFQRRLFYSQKFNKTHIRSIIYDIFWSLRRMNNINL